MIAEDRGDCVVWRAPACRESWFGHRLELDRSIDPAAGFARWEREQPGIDVDRRFLAWETPLDEPFPEIPARFAPSFGVGLERPPAPAARVPAVLPIEEAEDLEPAIAAAGRQHPQFGDGYRVYVRWLYEGLAAQGATMFVARDGDRVVAAATVVPGPDRLARFQEVWTDAAHRRRGLATALVTAAVRAYADRTLLILCDEGSEAHRIYVRCGFRPVSRWVELSTERDGRAFPAP